MFSFGKRPSIQSPGGGTAREFTRILEQWTEATRRSNVQLPSQAVNELKKRIKTPGKPKLDFFKCGLDDRMVTALVEILSDSPVIGKLDLGANYTSDQSAISLIRLLILQAKQVRETPVDQRLTAVYIGEVSFDHSKSVIQDKVPSRPPPPPSPLPQPPLCSPPISLRALFLSRRCWRTSPRSAAPSATPT